LPGQHRYLVQRPGLLEQVGGSRHDLQGVLAAQLGLRLPVQLQHQLVMATDDQQGRRPHLGQPGAGQVRSAAARHHRRDLGAKIGRRRQRRGRPGAGAEVPDRQHAHLWLPVQPSGRADQPFGQQPDVEHLRPVQLLPWGEQIQ
jgi:hypothetical protein